MQSDSVKRWLLDDRRTVYYDNYFRLPKDKILTIDTRNS